MTQSTSDPLIGDSSSARPTMSASMPRLASHILVTKGDQLLLLRRVKPPFVNKLVVPGGKMEPGESWQQCAQRELYEETGLIADRLQARVLLHERAYTPEWHWMIMLFMVDAADLQGVLAPHSPEGALAWYPQAGLDELECTPIDRWLYRRVLDSPQSGLEMIDVFFPMAHVGDYDVFEIL